MSLSIVVPAYNEEVLIADTVEHLVKTAPQNIEDVEIIIVDDGSTDSTGSIADNLASQYDNVAVFHHDQNKGFGATFRTGIEASSKEFVMCNPVDYHFTLAEFDMYLTIIKYSDIVIGYRRERRKDLGFYPWLVSSSYHKIVNFLFRLSFFDVNWIHLYKRGDIDKFLGKSDGVFLLAENLIRAQKNNLKVIGVDVTFTKRKAGVSTGVKTSTITKTLFELIKFFFQYHFSPGQYPKN